MAWEDIMKMRDLAEMINVDGDDRMPTGLSPIDKDRINRFLDDKDFGKMGLDDLIFTLNTLSILAKNIDARIPDNLRKEIEIVNRKLHIFVGEIVPFKRKLKEELEDLYNLNQVNQGKMTMRDFDEG